jgi:hypothetical protein
VWQASATRPPARIDNAGQLEVKTFDSSPALTNQIGFTVIVP